MSSSKRLASSSKLNASKPIPSKVLRQPRLPPPELEWSKWSRTKPIKGSYALPFLEGKKNNLQADFNFFGMDGEDRVFAMRERKDHGLYQTRSDFEIDVAWYQRSAAVKIISKEISKSTAKEPMLRKPSASIKPVMPINKARKSSTKTVSTNKVYTMGEEQVGNNKDALQTLKRKEEFFWRSKCPSKQSIEDVLYSYSALIKLGNCNLNTITTHEDLIARCEQLYILNTQTHASITSTGRDTSIADAIAEVDERKINQLLADGVSYDAIDSIYKRRVQHGRACKCGCQKYEAPHSLDEWCRCGCGYLYQG